MFKKKKQTVVSELFNEYLKTAILSELAFSACTVIDGILVSMFLGETALAAVGIVSPFPSILAIFSGMLSIGCQSQCSRYIGLGDRDKANSVYSTSALLAFIISLLVTAACMLYPVPIVVSWGAPADDIVLTQSAASYLFACSLGTIGMIMYYIFSPILSIEGSWKYIRMATTSMIVINIAGDLANIFVFDGGIFGMGLATAFSNLAAVGILAVGRLKNTSAFRFSLSSNNPKMIPNLMYQGLSKAVRRACNSIRPVFMNNLISSIAGVTALAAYSVQGNLRALLAVLSAGIAGTVSSLCGVFYAEQNIKDLREIIKSAFKKILLLAVPMSAILVFFAPFIVRLYIEQNSDAFDMAVFVVRCYCGAIPFVVFNEIYISYFQATGRVVRASIISALSRIGIIVPCALILSAMMGIKGVWLSLFFSELILSLIITVYALIRSEGDNLLSRFLVLPSGFGSDESDVFQITIHSYEQCIGIYNEIRVFLLNKGIDDRRAYLVSLFCEEMLCNIDSHGYKEMNDEQINLKIVHTSDDKLTIRIRDNCRLFDPIDWYNTHNPEDPASNIGIRIVSKMATEFRYSSTFKLNNIFIQL